MNSQVALQMPLRATVEHCAFAIHEIHALGATGEGFGESWPWYEVLIRPRADTFAGPPSAFVDRLYRERPSHLTDLEVLTRVIAWLAKRSTPTRVSFNTHPESLTRPGFVQSVLMLNEQAAADGHSICLELIEFADCRDRPVLVSNAKRLRSEGILIALDDFGSRLNCFDLCAAGIVDLIKIDTSVVNLLHQDANQRAIVESIRTLCRGLNAKVVAEGVETSNELLTLQVMGIDYAQGFYFHRPEHSEI